ncbi:hypothetical protein AKJ16_DCAP05264 [Drosera capensis]
MVKRQFHKRTYRSSWESIEPCLGRFTENGWKGLAHYGIGHSLDIHQNIEVLNVHVWIGHPVIENELSIRLERDDLRRLGLLQSIGYERLRYDHRGKMDILPMPEDYIKSSLQAADEPLLEDEDDEDEDDDDDDDKGEDGAEGGEDGDGSGRSKQSRSEKKVARLC